MHTVTAIAAGLSQRKLVISRRWSLESLENAIIDQYRQFPLAMTGFTFGRSNKGRKIELFSGTTVAELELFVAKSRLLIIPKRDLTVLEENQDVGAHGDSLPDNDITGRKCIFVIMQCIML